MIRRQSRTPVRHFGIPEPHPDQFEIGFGAPTPDRPLTRTERFERFHAANPHFYDEVVKLARQFRARTGRSPGIQGLIEAVRFDLEMQTSTDEEFKVNNDFASYYARLIMLREPDLAGFFQLRNAPAADAWIDRLSKRVVS